MIQLVNIIDWQPCKAAAFTITLPQVCHKFTTLYHNFARKLTISFHFQFTQ